MITFAQYLAEYIAEEINRGLLPNQIDSFFVQKVFLYQPINFAADAYPCFCPSPTSPICFSDFHFS